MTQALARRLTVASGEADVHLVPTPSGPLGTEKDLACRCPLEIPGIRRRRSRQNERNGRIDLRRQLSIGGQLMWQETSTERLYAGAHHDRSPSVTTAFPDELVVINAGDPLMRTGGNGGRGVSGHEWKFARELSAPDERDGIHSIHGLSVAGPSDHCRDALLVTSVAASCGASAFDG